MNLEIPRLRIFAGPNGSGKSTIKSVIKKELLSDTSIKQLKEKK